MSSSEHLQELSDPGRRKLLQQATAATGGVALAAASYPFVASLSPSERARAQGVPVEYDISRLLPARLRPSSGAASRSGCCAVRPR